MPPKRTAKRKSAKREEPAVVKDADASHSEDDSPSSDESEESEEETKPVVRKVNAFALLGGDDDDDDDDESEEEESEEEEEKPVKAKSKPANPFAALGGDSDDDDDDDESEEEEEKPVKAKSKPANPFAALGGDSDDDESESEEEEEEEDQKKAPVKTKPANPFAALGGDEDDDDDDSDNDKEEEEEKKKKVVVEEEKEEVKKPLTAAEKRKLKKKQQQQKKKNKSAADDDMDEFERALAEAKATVGLKDDEPQAKEPETQTEPVATETEKTKEEETSTAPAPTPATSTAPAPTVDGDKSDGDEGDEASGTTEGGEAKPLSAAEKKKLKNKKKKEKEKEKAAAAAAAAAEAPKKKVPAFVERKKQEMEERARLMEELEAERARLIKEEEERQAREEEEERKLEEKRRLKREKEKARKEKLKAEGLLLSKAEREKRARAMAQYGDIAAAVDKEDGEGEPQKKKVVYGKRKKQTPQQVQEAKEAHERQVKEEQEAKEQAERDANEGEESEEDLLDSWDAELSDDEGGAGVKQAPEPSKASDASSTTTSSSGPKTSNKKGSAVDDAADALLGSLAEAERSKAGVNVQKGMTLRSPICCVLGHVDTGKTKLLDKIRRTNVQNGEAGGITQQIGASYFPGETIQKLTERMMGDPLDLRVPGLLIIDTPGHESFSNLRSRGTSMCDMSILVVDIVHGLEPQTIESIQLLKRTKTPFVVALNKIDRLYEWKVSKDGSSRESLKRQQKNTLIEFNERLAHVKTQFAEQGLNAELYYENQDMRKYVSLIPTSAHTGEGIPDLLTLIIDLTQKLLVERLRFRPDDVECTVLEVKRLEGLGMTVDVILAQGALREGDTVVMCSFDGPVVTQIKALLMPPPLRELRVKADYEKHKEITAAQGVKVLCRNIESVVAGTQLYVCRSHDLDEIERLKKMVVRQLEASLAALETQDRGVYVMASTLGALEALLEYLRTSKVPVAGVNIGPVHRKDVVKASTQLQHDAKYAVIMAFDVPVDRDARHMAEELGLRIFTADIIYHLTDDFTAYLDEMKLRRKEELRHIAYFPVRLRIIPEFIFNKRDPIVLGVDIIDGQLRRHTPILVPSQGNCDLGVVIGIERDHKEVEVARKGQSVCVKIEHPSDKKMFGRHFDEKDELVSKCTRESIDALKEAFRDDLTKEDWVLVKGLKKLYGI